MSWYSPVAQMSPVTLRRWQIGLLVLGVFVTLMMAAMVAGCYRNDGKINAHKATTVGDVVSAGATKSAVSFTTPDGQFHNPRLGILYPGGLSVGQRISIDYDSTDPDLVRVTGRDASLSIIPAISVAGYTWLVIVAVMVLLAQVTWPNRRQALSVPANSGTADS